MQEVYVLQVSYVTPDDGVLHEATLGVYAYQEDADREAENVNQRWHNVIQAWESCLDDCGSIEQPMYQHDICAGDCHAAAGDYINMDYYSAEVIPFPLK